MTQEEMAELWIARIKDYRASGERVATWCEGHQVTPYQLFYWMRKLKKKVGQETPPAGGPQWVSLRLDKPSSGGAAPLLVRVGAVAIEVRSGFEPALFADVVRTLKTLC